jgi:hypothetical protein
MITPHRARSTLRRGSSRSGKKLPLRSFGIFTSTSPAGVDTVLGRDPFRVPLRSSERSQRPAPSRAVTSASISSCSASCTTVDSTSFNPCIPPLAASTSSTDRASFVRAIVGLLSSSWKNSPRFPRWPALCQPPPRKPTTWRDAYTPGINTLQLADHHQASNKLSVAMTG